VIKKPKSTYEAQKEALKLFAAGYNPLKNTAFPRIGKFNFIKIERNFGKIIPIVLYKCAGVNAYCVHKHDINSNVYHALYRLCSHAKPELYKDVVQKYYENL